MDEALFEIKDDFSVPEQGAKEHAWSSLRRYSLKRVLACFEPTGFEIR